MVKKCTWCTSPASVRALQHFRDASVTAPFYPENPAPEPVLQIPVIGRRLDLLAPTSTSTAHPNGLDGRRKTHSDG